MTELKRIHPLGVPSNMPSTPKVPEHAYINKRVELALAEDMPWGDITTTVIDPHLEMQWGICFKEAAIVCGLPVAAQVFFAVQNDSQHDVVWNAHVQDGAAVQAGEVVATVSGKAVSLLHAERVALNFLQRLSGIATLTRYFVDKAQLGSTHTQILDTRKTTPGLRLLEKYAVQVGGGRNHRMGLSDGIMLKDNHLAALKAQGMSLQAAVDRLRKQAPPGLRIEVEVDTMAQLEVALAAGVEWVLLDNMTIDQLQQAVQLARGKSLTEASGGVTLDNVQQVAACGVDFISVGALTHSARAIDIGLDHLPLGYLHSDK